MALTELVEPWMTVRLNGAVPAAPPTTSCSPVGADWKVSVTVRGSSWSDVDAELPAESVAVRTSSRYDGYE